MTRSLKSLIVRLRAEADLRDNALYTGKKTTSMMREAADALETAERHRDEAVEALKALADKLDAIYEPTKGIFVFADAHGLKYQGPNYGEELAAAHTLLQSRELDT